MLEKVWGWVQLGGYHINPGLDSSGGGRKEKRLGSGILLYGWKHSLFIRGLAECRVQRKRNEYDNKVCL